MNSENFTIDDLDFDDLNDIQIVKKNYKEVAKSKSEYLDILTYIQQIDSYSDVKKLKKLLLNVSNENIKKLMPHIIHYYISNKAEFLQILNKFSFSQTIKNAMNFEQLTLNIDNEDCTIPILSTTHKSKKGYIDDFDTIYNNFNLIDVCDTTFCELAIYFLYGKTSNNDLLKLFNDSFAYKHDNDRNLSDEDKTNYVKKEWNNYKTNLGEEKFECQCDFFKYLYDNFVDKNKFTVNRAAYDKSKKFIYIYEWPIKFGDEHKVIIAPYLQNLTLSDIDMPEKSEGKKSKKNLKELLKNEYNITFPPGESYCKLNNTPAIVYSFILDDNFTIYDIYKKVSKNVEQLESQQIYNFHIFEQYIDKKASGGVAKTNKLLSFINNLWLFTKQFKQPSNSLEKYLQIEYIYDYNDEIFVSVRYHIGNDYILILSIKELLNISIQMKVYIIDNTNKNIISNREFLNEIK